MTNETYDMLEKAVQVQLENIVKLDAGSKEGKEALAKATSLLEMLITVDKNAAECLDKSERRRIDEERNKAADTTERMKQEITWRKIGLKLSEVVVPLLVSFAGYDVFQKRILKFEEHGAVTSKAGRELHLPKFMK